jgi:hypothetical protein
MCGFKFHFEFDANHAMKAKQSNCKTATAQRTRLAVLVALFLWCPPHRSCHLSRGKAECMHASIACLLFHEDYVWVSLGNAMKAKQSKAKWLYFFRLGLAR